MPGYELINEREKNAVMDLFDEGGVLFAHGFKNQRKHYHVREFEKEICNKLNSSYALAVSSGSAAVKIALKAVGVRNGDEVITQAFNFIACVEAIMEIGAIPVICNVDETLNMDVEELETKITTKTKAILAVHMLGVPSDMVRINRLAKGYGIPVVEDNCEALGSFIGENYSGTVSDIGVLSFDFGKTITTGEGGALLTNNSKYDEFARQYHDHGHECNPKLPRGMDTRHIQGFNYRMTELQAVIGKVQLAKLDFIVKESKARFECLEEIFLNKIRPVVDNTRSNYDTFIFCEKNSSTRELIIKLLNNENFGTKNLPDAINWHSAFTWDHLLENSTRESIKKSHLMLNKSIAIPIFLSKSIKEYQDIAIKLSKIYS